MAAKFDLKSLLNNESVKQVSSKETNSEAVMIDIYDLIPSDDNFYRTDDIEQLKHSIEVLGVEQSLRVERIENSNKFKILAGHRRYRAVLELIEEGNEQLRKVPCIVKEKKSDLLSKLSLIITNSTTRELSDWEKMKQAIDTEIIVIELKSTIKIPGGVREILSDLIQVSGTQLARYKVIYNKLIPELIEAFKEGKINLTVAYEVAGLSIEKQLEAYKKYLDNGLLSIADIKKLKEIPLNNTMNKACTPLSKLRKRTLCLKQELLSLSEDNELDSEVTKDLKNDLIELLKIIDESTSRKKE